MSERSEESFDYKLNKTRFSCDHYITSDSIMPALEMCEAPLDHVHSGPCPVAKRVRVCSEISQNNLVVLPYV